MVEKFEAPVAACGDLSYEELQALIARGRLERSKAAASHVRSLFAIIGRLFRSGRKTEAGKPLIGSTAEA